MAGKKVQNTCALDTETNRKLEQLAAKWSLSKSEVLRTIVHSASDAPTPLQAFEALQRSLKLSPKRAAQWQNRVRVVRRASSSRLVQQSRFPKV
jgi:hypothetical protein